jgi:lipopolysaccharide export system protein LptA
MIHAPGRTYNTIRTFAILLAVWLATGAALAAPAAAPTPQPAAAKTPADYNVKITADELNYDDKKKLLVLNGNVTFTHIDSVVTAPHAEFETEKQLGHFTGGVKITQPGTTITSSELDAFYGERKAVLTGNVEMITEKAPTRKGAAPAAPARTATDKKPAKALPTVMLTDKLEYFWEKAEADAFGNVKIRQGDKRAFSDRAHYTGAINQIRLFSNVRFEQGKDNWMTSEEAIVDVAQETFNAKGGVEAYVIMEQGPPKNPPLRTPQGDRVLKPSPPLLNESPAPDGVKEEILKPQ